MYKRQVEYIETRKRKRMLVEDIQDIIEEKLMAEGKYDLAKTYIIYRYKRELVRRANTTDDSILSLIKNSNKDVMEENSNKNAVVASTQRDLIAGEVSKDLTKRLLLPEKIAKAHEEGVLHFHDADYFVQPIFNCCLINIQDMLDNGTVMNGKLIESPKSFQVACTVMTQIISAVASSQYGGQSVDIRHLGKYLRKSYKKMCIRDRCICEYGLRKRRDCCRRIKNSHLYKKRVFEKISDTLFETFNFQRIYMRALHSKDVYKRQPLQDEEIKVLEAGDYVYISGTVYTARDAAHKRMYEAMNENENIPLNLEHNVIYYMGPSPAREGHPIGSAGPTTSSRMDKYAPLFMDHGLKGMIGKGKRSKEVVDAIVRNGAVYFAAVGGAGAILSKTIKKAEVIAYDDLGTEAIRKLEVENLPAIVVIDSKGNNLYETAIKAYRKIK